MTAGSRPCLDATIKKSETSDVLDGTEGPEVDGLHAALKRAEKAAKGVPVDKQAKECESFLSRARAHAEELERKRSAVAASIDAAGKRLVVLRLQQECPPSPPPDTSSQVRRLQDLVSQLQAQLRGQSSDPHSSCVPIARLACRSGHGRVLVPAMPCSIPAELSAWLKERHTDLHDAFVNGDNGRVLELISQLAEGAERMV